MDFKNTKIRYLAENSIIESINMSIMNKVCTYLCPSLAGWHQLWHRCRCWASASCHFPIPFPSPS